MTVPTGPGESPRRLNDDGTGLWFDPGDGSDRVSIGDLVPDEIRPGDAVELYPVTADGVKGWVVVHRPERDEPERVRGDLVEIVPPSQPRSQIETERARLRDEYARLLAAVEREEAAAVRAPDDAAGQALDLALRGQTYVEIPYSADMSATEYPIPDEELTPDYRAGYADGLADAGEPGVISSKRVREIGRATLQSVNLFAGTTADDYPSASIDPAVDESDDEPEIGPVERALIADLRSLKPGSQLSRTMIASALTLARALDNAPADKIASIGKELREHVKRIEETAGADDDTRDHTASLSTPI